MSIARKRLLVYAAIFLSLIAGINLIRDINRMSRSDERLAEAKAELEAVQQESRELERSIGRAGDSFWQESKIRNVLKMARPDEIIVIVPDKAVEPGLETDFSEVSEFRQKDNLTKWLTVFGFGGRGV